MRRTTICRSSASFIAAAVLAGIAAGPVAAQQNPPPPPAGQPPAPAAAGAPLPASHVVQAGETLWSLAQQFFGDPLLWPEIYRLNTDVVEDPHWIFPGEELRLVAAAQPVAGEPARPTVVTITPSGDTVRQAPPPPPVAPETPTIFSPLNQPGAPRQEELEVVAARAYRAVREGEYYSAGFLTEDVDLRTGRLLGNVQASAIRRLSTRSTATLFTEVTIEPPPGDTLSPGDLVLTMRREGDIRGYGDVVRPTGLLRVTEPSDRGRMVARVVAVYGAINDGQEVLRVARFQMSSSARPLAVDTGITGEVIGLLDPTDLVNLQKALFINRGVQEGVGLGDVFRISAADRAPAGEVGGTPQQQAEAMVVSVRPHTATLVVISLTRPDVRAGSVARQIRRMPS